MKFLAHIIDAALNRYAPTVHGRTYQVFTTDMTGADWLTDREAEVDALDGDDLYLTDEQWAAEQRRLHNVHITHNQPAGAGEPAAVPPTAAEHPGVGGSQPPVGAEVTPRASATGADGSTTADEVALTLIVSDVLSACEVHLPTYTAGVVARELLHHFEFHHK